jgi:hypothetical protein
MRARVPSGDPVTSDISRSALARARPQTPAETLVTTLQTSCKGGYPPRSAAQSDQVSCTRTHNMTSLITRVPAPPVGVKASTLLPRLTLLVWNAFCMAYFSVF